MNQISCLPALAKSVDVHSHQHGQDAEKNKKTKQQQPFVAFQTKHNVFAQRGQKRYFFGANTNLLTLDIN